MACTHKIKERFLYLITMRNLFQWDLWGFSTALESNGRVVEVFSCAENHFLMHQEGVAQLNYSIAMFFMAFSDAARSLSHYLIKKNNFLKKSDANFN